MRRADVLNVGFIQKRTIDKNLIIAPLYRIARQSDGTLNDEYSIMFEDHQIAA